MAKLFAVKLRNHTVIEDGKDKSESEIYNIAMSSFIDKLNNLNQSNNRLHFNIPDIKTEFEYETNTKNNKVLAMIVAELTVDVSRGDNIEENIKKEVMSLRIRLLDVFSLED